MPKLILPLVIVLEVVLIILPLPIFLLDFLLLFSIAFSLILLFSCLSIEQTDKFSSLPSLILLSTLFRLSLNIATTRQILAFGKAPDVVAVFGEFVVAGNVIVGLLIFFIISIVQFIVIAKGSERVAEVAARFSLDAMPGRQLSIDSDLRSGIINLQEARELRSSLQRESRLYGALDGAMKFVKGDTIASLVIAIINILSGFILGVIKENLSFSEALNKYTIFTIGDGLMSQIPALFTAIAAGVIVTRVSGREDCSLEKEIKNQLFSKKELLVLTSALLFLLVFIPGFSIFSSIILGLIILLSSRLINKEDTANEEANRFSPKTVFLITIYFGKDIYRAISSNDHFYNEMIKLKNDFYNKTGIILNEISYKLDQDLLANEVKVYFYDVLDSKRQIKEVSSSALEIIELIKHLLINYRADLITDTQTRLLLDLNHSIAEDLINELIPKSISLTKLTKLLKRLISENISIKNIPLILQAISESVLPKDASLNNEELLLAEVRCVLRRAILSELVDSRKSLKAWILGLELDKIFEEATLNGVILHPKIVLALEESLSFSQNTQTKIIIVCSKFARASVFKSLRNRLTNLTVIAFDELLPEIKLEVQGELSFEENKEINLQSALLS